jgi:hypothetical protein
MFMHAYKPSKIAECNGSPLDQSASLEFASVDRLKTVAAAEAERLKKVASGFAADQDLLDCSILSGSLKHLANQLSYVEACRNFR